jgi:hypothetical protein
VTGGGAWVSVRWHSKAAVTAQIANAAMTSTVWRAIAAYRRTWDWSRPKQFLPNSKSSSTRHLSSAARISRAHARALAFGDEAVVEGQLAAGQVAADQQVMLRRGGGQQRPRIPALPLGARPGGAGLAAAHVLEQAGDRLGARRGDAARQGEAEAGRDPQHIALAVVFQELAQFGAGAVDLVSADEVQPDPAGERLGEEVDGQLALGAEHQVQRQPHHQRLHRVLDLLGRDPLPGADQRVPGALAHIRQVHRGDAVGDLAHAPQVVAFHTRRHGALLDLAGLIDRPDPQAPLAAACAVDRR